MKRQKIPFIRRRKYSSDSEDNAPVETPHNDTKLRLLLSEYPHDTRFIFKTLASKYDQYFPRKCEQDLSLQVQHEIYKPDVSPAIFRANKAMVEQSPVYEQKALLSLKEAITSLSPLRRKGCFLNPSSLPTPVAKVKIVKRKNLKEMVRRKSCHCNDCGGVSKLEKKTMHLPPEPLPVRKIKPFSRVNTSKRTTNPPQNASARSKATARRGSIAGLLFTKVTETDDLLTREQLTDIKTRPRHKTYDAPRPVSLLVPQNTEKEKEETASGPVIERKHERSTSRKISQKAKGIVFDRSLLLKQESFTKNVNIKQISSTRETTPKLKRIEIKRTTPLRTNVAPLVLYTEQSTRVRCIESKPSSHRNSKMNLISERANSEVAERPSLAASISKDVKALKNLLTPNLKDSKPLKMMVAEKNLKISPFGVSLEKINNKHTSGTISHKRALSLPRVQRETPLAVQKKISDISQSSQRQHTGERDGNSEIQNKIRKVQIRNRSQVGDEIYRPETQTSRDLKSNLTHRSSPNEIFVRNMKLTLEDDKSTQKRHKKKKGSKVNDTLWKDYMQSALLQYRENFMKSNRISGSQSQRHNQKLTL